MLPRYTRPSLGYLVDGLPSASSWNEGAKGGGRSVARIVTKALKLEWEAKRGGGSVARIVTKALKLK